MGDRASAGQLAIDSSKRCRQPADVADDGVAAAPEQGWKVGSSSTPPPRSPQPSSGLTKLLRRFGILALDMETAGLYGLASELGAEALSVLTVSDHLMRGERMSAEERETGIDAMTRLVLDALLS
jgi:purine-nucleoside phosphorylase